MTNLAGNHYIYAASGKYDLESKTEFDFEDDGRTLVLTGLVVEIISETGEPAPTAGDSMLKSSLIIDVLPGWESLARLHESTLGQKRHDMFWRTTLLNRKVDEIHSLCDTTSSRHSCRLDSEERFIPPGYPSEEGELLRKMMTLQKRRFFVTVNGGMGIGPEKVVTGDVVCVLLSSEVPTY